METRPRVQQGEAALLVRARGAAARPEPGPREEAEAEGSELGAQPGGRRARGAWTCGHRVGQQLPCGWAGSRRLCLQREQRAVRGLGERVPCHRSPGAERVPD